MDTSLSAGTLAFLPVLQKAVMMVFREIHFARCHGLIVQETGTCERSQLISPSKRRIRRSQHSRNFKDSRGQIAVAEEKLLAVVDALMLHGGLSAALRQPTISRVTSNVVPRGYVIATRTAPPDRFM